MKDGEVSGGEMGVGNLHKMSEVRWGERIR